MRCLIVDDAEQLTSSRRACSPERHTRRVSPSPPRRLVRSPAPHQGRLTPRSHPTEGEPTMDMTDEQIRDDVRAELASDQRLPQVDEIAVDAYAGAVTLRGTVGSFAQLRAAVADARRTRGVYDVFDELQVRLLNDDRRKDAEIRGAALQRLIWDSEIPAESLDVHVKDGWVTITGNVDYQFQSDAAFDRVAGLHGVTGVTNEITVVETL
jgi:osmotically-inducible protein OsmY